MTTRPNPTGKTPTPKTQARKAAPRAAAARGTSAPRAAAQSATRAAAKKGPSPAGTAESPILPVEQLEALRKIKPGAVDWVIEQTQLEAEHRRAEVVRLNNLIFIEHLFAQAAALLVAACGIGGGVWLAVRGQPWVGVAIAAVVMAALAVVQLSGRARRP